MVDELLANNPEELRKKAFWKIARNEYLYRKWNDAKTDSERELMIIDAVREYIVETCIGEIYAADEPADAVKMIRVLFGD